MDLAGLEGIKRLTIKGLFSDDDLMDVLVLKGGNALDIIYGIAPRASLDIDLSMADDFEQTHLDQLREKMERALVRTFDVAGYRVFDVTLHRRPEEGPPQIPTFWGGYRLCFKLIAKTRADSLPAELSTLRKQAEEVGPNHLRTFKVDISKYEYCGGKEAAEIDGYTVYVYSPSMLAFEKLRAICQQTREYSQVFGKTGHTARARDFFDIHAIVEHFKLEVTAPENLESLKRIFDAKQVPLQLLSTIADYREFHRQDFATVTDNLKPGVEVYDFDFYFDYVIKKCAVLTQALGVIQPPFA